MMARKSGYIGEVYTAGPSGRAGPIIRGSERVGDIKKRDGAYYVVAMSGATTGPYKGSDFKKAGSTDLGYARLTHYTIREQI